MHKDVVGMPVAVDESGFVGADEQASHCLALLMDFGWLRSVDTRSSTTYELHPKAVERLRQ